MSDLTAQVLATVNAPYGANHSAHQLAALIMDPSSADSCNASAFAFFSEVAPAIQNAFIAEMKVDVAQAKAVASQFSKMAGYSLALAA
jgi:hypothetical protein